MFIVESDQRLILHHQHVANGRTTPFRAHFPFDQSEKHLPIRPICAIQPTNARRLNRVSSWPDA
jgi:hypothetical protein